MAEADPLTEKWGEAYDAAERLMASGDAASVPQLTFILGQVVGVGIQLERSREALRRTLGARNRQVGNFVGVFANIGANLIQAGLVEEGADPDDVSEAIGNLLNTLELVRRYVDLVETVRDDPTVPVPAKIMRAWKDMREALDELDLRKRVP